MTNSDVVVVSETVIDVVDVSPGNVDLLEIDTQVVEVGVVGPQGPKGDTGNTGPQGPQGPAGSGDFSYHFVQSTPAAVWVIVHNLNGYPNVSVVDSAGSQVEGDVVYDTANQITVTFVGAFAGDAYLS